MGTAHSLHPMTLPNLNKTMHALCKTTRKLIKHKYNKNQITMGTAHLSHPIILSNVYKTMCTLCKTQENSIQLLCHEQQITLCTVHAALQPLLLPNLYKTIQTYCKTKKTQSTSHATNSKSHYAQLIQHRMKNGKYERIGNQNES